MSDDWQNAPATDKQKEKLRFFGCTWCGDITVGKANDALEECAKQFPGIEAAYKNRPATDDQLEELQSLRREPVRALTCDEAAELIETIKTSNAIQSEDEAAVFQNEANVKTEVLLQIAEPEVANENPPPEMSQPPVEAQNESSREVTIQEAVISQSTTPSEYTIPASEVQSFLNSPTVEEPPTILPRLRKHIADLKSQNKYIRKIAIIALGRSKEPLAIGPIISCLADTDWGVRVQAVQSLGDLGFPDAVEPLIESLKSPELYLRKTAADALGKIMDTRAIHALVTLALEDSKEIVRQAAALALARIQGKPLTYDRYAALDSVKELVAEFAGQKVEQLLKDCLSSDDCHWLPMAKAANLVQIVNETKISIGQSRQIADKIQWAGYSVEPDARFGGGSYDWNQTLGLFKPSESDLPNPSAAYLGAANLLRLCVLIAAADGQIDKVELDVFRQVIENQLDLTQTDHRRLQVLEKLLVQDPTLAARFLAKVAKSIPAHKRLLIGKVLVRVAAADNVITKDERRALERIFKVFEILPDTLENLIRQACPPPQDATIQETGMDASSGRIPKPFAAPAPGDFTLDMEKVYSITNETKEVVGILSVVMEDEPEKSITLPTTIILPTPVIPPKSSDEKTAPQPPRFNGLDVAFHPILERLMTRDSWPQTDFIVLAREFHFMPLNIRDTLNEWADEALGDFILDGEDPIVVRRELIVNKDI